VARSRTALSGCLQCEHSAAEPSKEPRRKCAVLTGSARAEEASGYGELTPRSAALSVESVVNKRPGRNRTAIPDIRRAILGRRRTVTPELLQKVAEVYRQHFDKPTEAVRRSFDVSHRHRRPLRPTGPRGGPSTRYRSRQEEGMRSQ
jgi:hypothetical protein